MGAFGAAIARAVRAERSRLGLTQAELGERLGWERGRLSGIERHSRALLADDIPQLCRALGVPLSRLLVDVDQDDIDALDLGA